MTKPSHLIDNQVYGIERCPQCGVAKPLLQKIDKAHKHYTNSDTYDPQEYWYFTTRCSSCENHVLFYGKRPEPDVKSDSEPEGLSIVRSFPELEQASDELPPMALKFFQQALESRHAPDGALMLAASSIDSMLKDKGFTEGSLFTRIGDATKSGLLTAEMEAWAHEIRLSANEPRHADDDFEGATTEDAEQIIAFAKALGEYLYVLPSRVRRWQSKAAEQVESA